jgi:hypothetical protein
LNATTVNPTLKNDRKYKCLFVFSGNFARAGTYNGLESANARHIYLGFRPKFIWFKNSSITASFIPNSKPRVVQQNDQSLMNGNTPNWTDYNLKHMGKTAYHRMV